MSASTERKNRQAARAAGTDKKMLAAQEEAKKKAISKRRWTLGTIAVILLIALILFLDSGFLYTKTTALTIGDTKYSPAEVNYRYGNQYYTLLNQYGNYASMLGIDTSAGVAGLDKQDCPMLDGGTWKDYFLEAATNEMVQTKALNDYAAENGISLSEEEIAEVNDSLADMDSIAKERGYANADNFFAANYGNGVTTAIVREAGRLSTLASKAYSSYQDSLSYTDEQLEEYYQSLEGASDRFDYMLYTVTAPVEEDAEAPTEQALAEAQATAEAIYMAYADGTDIEDPQERFEVAVDSQLEGETPTLRSAAYGSSLSEDYAEWMMAADREAGDVTTTANDTGSSVVVFLSRDDNHYKTANVRHILVMAEASEDGTYSDEAKAAAKARAEEILAEYEAGEKTEESFAALAEQYSEDTGSNTNGGLYENIAKGQMVEEFDAFCFADHQPGDTAIVYGESSGYAGYHVMYYVGEGDLYSNTIARSDLLNRDMQEWIDGLTANYEAVPGSAYRRIG